MSEVPDDFKCTVPTWGYIYGLCRDVSTDIRGDSFEPDVVVALARGGWFAGRCLCDFLGLDDLASLKMEHYVGTAERGEEATVRYPMAEGSVEGKNVLIVDDIAETGKSMERAREYVEERGASDVRTSLLQLLPDCTYEPNYVGEHLAEWAWVVYPWNFIEDMIELTEQAMAGADSQSYSVEDVRELLCEHHQLERETMEIAQPDRLGEVLTEMERRKLLTRTDGGRWRPVELADGVE